MVKVRGFLKPLSQHVFPPLTFSHCFLASAPPHPISIFLLYFLTVSSDGDPRNYQHITFTKSWLLLVMIKRSIPLQATICKFLKIFRAYKYCQPYTIYWVCIYKSSCPHEFNQTTGRNKTWNTVRHICNIKKAAFFAFSLSVFSAYCFSLSLHTC